MQISEADDEGESDTKAPPGPFRDKQELPLQMRKKGQEVRVGPRTTSGESRLGEAVAAVRAKRCPGPR